MNIETFGVALDMAVDEQFAVDEGLVMIIDAMTDELSRRCQESMLGLIRDNQRPGLRLDVARVLAANELAHDSSTVLRQAREQAVAGVVRGFVRKKYQEIVQSETKRNY